MSVLGRINTVGMAVHQLDHITDQPNDLKNKVRGRMDELLIGSRLQHSGKGNGFADKEKKSA